jgi:hypothetical protein
LYGLTEEEIAIVEGKIVEGKQDKAIENGWFSDRSLDTHYKLDLQNI